MLPNLNSVPPPPPESDPQATERQLILRQYRRLLRFAKPTLLPGDAKIIKRAFNLSMEAHKEMRRKSGEPYILHPLAVAQTGVEEIGLGPTSIIAALLHDVVEDTEYEVADIEREFGPKVARIVDGLTKISGTFEYGTSQQAENFRKMLLTLSDDVRVILIKIADRLHNMRTLDSMPRDKQLKIAAETIYLYAPLAHRLGLYSIKGELEDLHLKVTDPETYYSIYNRIRQSEATRKRLIRDFTAPIEEELNRQGFKFEIKGRPKSVSSVLKKMRKQNIPFDEVYDLFAVRLILDVVPEEEKISCWQVYSIVTDFYQPNPDRLRDWVSVPKANGYESLHTTVMSSVGQWVEVQIRSRRMDDIAEKGYAAHWKYKDTGAPAPDTGLEQWIASVRELLENNDASALEFVSDFRRNFFAEEVFVFTPKGRLVVLPGHSSVLDFAFEIHSQIGLQCLGAKVNQKLVPLSYELKNGDQIEIITSKTQKPAEDWLKFVVTAKARSKIRDFLRDERRAKTDDGRLLIEARLHALGIEPTRANLGRLLAYYQVFSLPEFYYRIAIGQIDAREIAAVLFDPTQPLPKTPLLIQPNAFDQKVQQLTGKPADDLVVSEHTPLRYSLATCCNPIPGDDVFGFESPADGIIIHRTTCPKATELLASHGNRIVKTKWTDQQELAFLGGLRIQGADRVGLVSDVTRIISTSLKVNMRSITVDSNDGLFEGRLVVYVNDTAHLDRLIHRLQRVNGVLLVERFES
ncbi:MAG: bifunctional (p)ppGpp synthetase/guanosine-3',5'-bis(diphosphate) 3'-pyrophosphohydrolase [Hymenobacteraceae bacterium]|nr:bifunctional (p)ppGpp synthetase/guanosine-3',5'-bis(diphosphate) 3'-pyrophosphohydrolase [Hymenobacteraceae bacterium]